MANRHDDGLDLFLGLLFGLSTGILAGILLAPKPGTELRNDLKGFVNNLPNEVNVSLTRSKGQYKELLGRTKEGIETQIERRNERRQAIRMAEAKRREEQEAGYDY